MLRGKRLCVRNLLDLLDAEGVCERFPYGTGTETRLIGKPREEDSSGRSKIM